MYALALAACLHLQSHAKHKKHTEIKQDQHSTTKYDTLAHLTNRYFTYIYCTHRYRTFRYCTLSHLQLVTICSLMPALHLIFKANPSTMHCSSQQHNCLLQLVQYKCVPNLIFNAISLSSLHCAMFFTAVQCTVSHTCFSTPSLPLY